MKHSDAQHHLARISRNLYDDSPEKAAITAAAAALKFVHSIACHNGPVSIPVHTLFDKIKIEAEPETVLQPPLKPYEKPSEETPHAEAHAVDQGSPPNDHGHDETRHTAIDH